MSPTVIPSAVKKSKISHVDLGKALSSLCRRSPRLLPIVTGMDKCAGEEFAAIASV